MEIKTKTDITCPDCKGIVSGGDLFCKHCGEELPKDLTNKTS